MELNTVIHGDCLEVMKTFPDKSIDLIVTDPPYGMDYQSSRRTVKYEKLSNDSSIEWIEPFLKESYRILKDNSHIYIFCNDYAISDFRHLMEAVGFTPKRTLVWVKNNHTSGDLEGDYGNKTEFILYGQKGRRLLSGKRETNVLKFNRVETNYHPTEKPIDLMGFLISKSSEHNDIVLDPFLGGGSTCIAAQRLHRNFIGIELDEGYVEIANKRLKQMVLAL